MFIYFINFNNRPDAISHKNQSVFTVEKSLNAIILE